MSCKQKLVSVIFKQVGDEAKGLIKPVLWLANPGSGKKRKTHIAQKLIQLRSCY